MSISIRWEPDKPVKLRSFNGTTRMWQALKEVFTFGSSNVVVLGETDVPTLRAMGRADPSNEFYASIANAIDQHGSIRIWAEW